MIPALLYLMATIDGGFAGFRDAAGRNPRLDKRAYFRRAVIRGLIASQCALLVVGAFVGAVIAVDPEPQVQYVRLVSAGTVMLWVYVPYGVAVITAFIFYFSPSVDVCTLTSVVIFGPFTLIRPLVIIGGGLWAISVVPEPRVIAAIVIACGAVLAVGRGLDRLWAGGWLADAKDVVGMDH